MDLQHLVAGGKAFQLSDYTGLIYGFDPTAIRDLCYDHHKYPEKYN